MPCRDCCLRFLHALRCVPPASRCLPWFVQPGGDTCSIPLFPSFVFASVALLLLALSQLALVACCVKRCRASALAKAREYEPLNSSSGGVAATEEGLSSPHIVTNPLRRNQQLRAKPPARNRRVKR